MKKLLLACKRGWSPFGGAGEVVPVPRNADEWTTPMSRWMDKDRRDRSRESLEKIRQYFTIRRNVIATVDFIRASFP